MNMVRSYPIEIVYNHCNQFCATFANLLCNSDYFHLLHAFYCAIRKFSFVFFLVSHDHFSSSIVLIIEFIMLVILYASIYYVWFFYSLITYNHSQNIWDAPIFIWNSLLREKFNIYFSRAFGCIEKNFTNLGIFLIFPNFLRS